MWHILLALLSVLCPGDANGDNKISILDLSMEAGYFLQTVPPGTKGDVNHDGVVNMLDISMTAAHYGRMCIVVPMVSHD